MKHFCLLGMLPGLLFAQSTVAPSQSWSGLLVAAGCQANERDRLTATDEVRTPPVDSVDTRGSAPLTGERSPVDDKALTQGLDASCRIGERTTAFALRLSDGSMLTFDDASNVKIARESRTGNRLKHKTKIFRAIVKGAREGDTVRLDSIRM